MSDSINTVATFNSAVEIVNSLIKNKAIPESIENPIQALAIVKFADEIKMHPMIALNNLSIVKGKLYQSSEYLAGLFVKSGYKYKMLEYTTTKNKISVCDKYDSWFEFEYDIERARQEGLTKSKLGNKDYNKGIEFNKYLTQPARMLFLRNIRQAVLTLAPELLLGSAEIEASIKTEPEVPIVQQPIIDPIQSTKKFEAEVRAEALKKLDDVRIELGLTLNSIFSPLMAKHNVKTIDEIPNNVLEQFIDNFINEYKVWKEVKEADTQTRLKIFTDKVNKAESNEDLSKLAAMVDNFTDIKVEVKALIVQKRSKINS